MQKLDQRLQKNMDIKSRKLFAEYFDCQKRKRDQKIAALEQFANQLEIKQTQLISAIKKNKLLEILKDKELKNSKKKSMTFENYCYEESLTLWRGQL